MYEQAKIAVDPVIFSIKAGELKILLHRREKDPFNERYELPGGLLRPEEKPEKRLNQKLKKMVGKQEIYFDQFNVFTDPDRDPRDRTISIGYIALVSKEEIENEENWFNARKLPEMAFDHREIISKAEKYLKENLDTVVVKQFMPELFPLNDLQKAYEVIEQKSYDNRNFRRKMIKQGTVEKTNKKQKDVPHRPASLYHFSQE
jgi:8-oxo-dGTP diphosphatase